MRYISKYFSFPAILASSLLFTGCDKFLDVKPKGYTLLTTVSDYSMWLDATDLYWFKNYDQLNHATDLVDVANPAVPPTASSERAYIWDPLYAIADNNLWITHYQAISSYNSVITGVDDATEGTEREKRVLKAEARLGRANEYLYLVNEYGKSYDSATADKDPGVPVVVSDDVAQQVPGRSSVKEIYDFIIGDLNAALPDLPEDNAKNRFRGSRAAAYSLLARTYLYARNYADAAKFAQLAMDASPYHKVIDYTALTSGGQVPNLSVRPDAIYARMGTWAHTPSLEHLRRYNVQDKRLRLFHSNLGNYTFTQRGVVKYMFGGFAATGIYENLGTSIQEMMLIVAEVAARKNELPKALGLLDEIRRKRIPAAYYQAYTSADMETVLAWVLLERTLEFPFNGQRWFDMRRLNAEGRMPAVNRYDALGNIIATLAPGSPRYTLQIPLQVLEFNPEMVMNP